MARRNFIPIYLSVECKSSDWELGAHLSHFEGRTFVKLLSLGLSIGISVNQRSKAMSRI